MKVKSHGEGSKLAGRKPLRSSPPPSDKAPGRSMILLGGIRSTFDLFLKVDRNPRESMNDPFDSQNIIKYVFLVLEGV